MDKYGVVPDAIRCTKCNGSDPGCSDCAGTGRTTKKIDPVKEAEMLKNQMGGSDGQRQGSGGQDEVTEKV